VSRLTHAIGTFLSGGILLAILAGAGLGAFGWWVADRLLRRVWRDNAYI